MDKQWSEIEGFSNYIVSNEGDITNNKTGRTLSPSYSSGYAQIRLSYKGWKQNFLVHRLVAIYFVDNPNNKPEVNHKDGVKINNLHTNLEWVTHAENIQHAYNNLPYKSQGKNGEANAAAKLATKDVLKIRASKDNLKNLSKQYKVSVAQISNIKNRKSWVHI